MPEAITENEWQRRENTLRVVGGKKCDLCHIMTGHSKQLRSEMSCEWQCVNHLEKRLYRWPYGQFIRTESKLDQYGELYKEDVIHKPRYVCKSCLEKYKGILRNGKIDIGCKA